MRNGTISKATIGRLPLYLQFIRTVKTEMVSSATVARHLGLGEVQVRKDLASVCPAGMPKIGYPTERLLNDLEAVLGMKQTVPAVVVGAGKLGRALMAYDGFRENCNYIDPPLVTFSLFQDLAVKYPLFPFIPLTRA